MIAGIDIGISTTKITGLDGGAPQGFCTVPSSDPVASASGALGRFLSDRGLPLKALGKLAVTGLGAESLGKELLGVPCQRVDEFQATGRGGLYLSGLARAVVVNMGTGTTIIRAAPDGIRHLGGSGVGGGTLLGLARCILATTEIPVIVEAAAGGDLANVDLLVGDLLRADLQTLPRHATASNFGKLEGRAARGDYALGILNLVFQTVGVLASFAARETGLQDVVLTGRLVSIPQSRAIFDGFAGVSPASFHFPEHAEYATAVGAALALEG